jgi:hypothetical protein
MDGDLSEKDNNLEWWWNQLKGCKDWNSLPESMRKDLVAKVQRGINHLLDLSITRDDITELIKLTDLPTVWDAIVSTCSLSKEDRGNRYQLLKYLRTTAINMWQSQHPIREQVFAKRPPVEENIKRKGKPVSWEIIEESEPVLRREAKPRGRPNEITEEVKSKVVNLRMDNLSVRKIHHLLQDSGCGVSLRSIYNICSGK